MEHPEPIKAYLTRHISKYEGLSQTYADTAADQSLPADTRAYWQNRSDEHHTIANTHRQVLRAIVWGLVS